MKKIINYIFLFLGIGIIFSACEDWITPEANITQNFTERETKSSEYYENLRVYKKTKHSIAFGWFGGWNGGYASTCADGAISSAPDSMDIISIWSKTYYNLDEARKKDLKYVQEVLGTKVTYTVFSHNMINLFYTGNVFENKAENIPAAAKALVDSIHKYGYDGIDFDHECGSADLFHNKENMTTLLREVRKHLGKREETGKIILVDGDLGLITEEGWSYVDYAVSQSYGKNKDSDLQSRYNTVKRYVASDRFIVTENFEAHWKTGGVTYTLSDGKTLPSLLGMAQFNPAEGRKGGVGAYHFEYEYGHNPDYKYMRQAIQMMNPANPN